MADYRDRLRENIQLTSPDGAVFTPRWTGNPRSQSKKIGIFNFPNVNGSIVQDLGTTGTTYAFTLYFEGPNNDLESDAFMAALRERGVWEVIHPVHGLKKLQPVSFTENTDPVKSGNVTQFDTEWIEPLELAALPSASELQASIAAQIETVNEVAAEQLEQSTFQKIAAEIAAFRDAVNNVVSAVEDNLQALSNFAADIAAEIEAIKRDIDNVLSVVPLDVISLAGQIQELIQLPARAIDDIQTRLDTYENFAEDLGLISPDTTGRDSYNRVAVQECALTAVFCAVADISSTGSLTSRSQAVQVIEANQKLFSDAIDVLDSTQELFEGQPIDRQYFSQSQSYSDSGKLVSQTVAYLLRSLFDLKTEKRFTLDRNRNPVMVTIEEYGSLGEGDINLDLFLESNQIEGNEHLIMPKGRELVVYV
jgi:hypothetical protein